MSPIARDESDQEGIRLLRFLLALALLDGWSGASRLAAQTPVSVDSSPRWWLSGQLNIISQWHAAFHASYSGTNSLRPVRENATSAVGTLYTGARIGTRTELLLDVESAGGGGISQAFGLAGFTNLDVVRNPTLGAAPYVARALIRHTFALGAETEPGTRGPLALLTSLPVRRLSVTAGKLGMPDFFDVNGPGSDSHLQFLNWTIDNNGAYDYAADTRGYTIGAIVEYRDREWAVRWGEGLMPKVANGIKYDWDLTQAHGDNLEVELDHGLLPGHAGVVRVLGYVNHADMGSYREAIDAFVSGKDSVLDVTVHRRRGRTKAGTGVNVEQSLGRGVAAFARAGLNDGAVESFAYTEVDRSVELGIAWMVPPWRHQDRVGIALVSNGLASEHRDYLARGGLGFLLGDGALTYGPERIVEAYYTCAVGWGFSLAFDVQHVANPGYNRGRGPVTVFAVRAHIDAPRAP